MLDNLISDILAYIGYLKNKCGYSITVHGVTNGFDEIRHRFAEHSIHDVSYCLAIKASREAWDKCISSQVKIREKCCDRAFFGMCHAGVEEFVFPVNSAEGDFAGFVSVSGYRTDSEKALPRIKAAAKKYMLNFDDLLKLYNQMSDNPPEHHVISTLIMPLAHMLGLLYDKAKELYPRRRSNKQTADYIYSFSVAYIRRNFASRISIKNIADLCHCSESHVSHIFKHFGGISVGTYINSLRVKNAKELLITTHLSVSEISELTGFSDSNYFTFVFKKTAGVPPLKYRAAKREIINKL